MKVGILTSSRADYSQYYPLLKLLDAYKTFDLTILAFGTHLSPQFGQTVQHIYGDGFKNILEFDTVCEGDLPENINASIAKTVTVFSQLWKTTHFDVVFAFGDRYEMFAACASAVSFGVRIAHIHGGETTMGAIDNTFRHVITHMASLHFTTTEIYKKRVIELTGNDQGVYNVGALSVDNLKSIPLLSISAFKEMFNIDLSIPTILVTFHPETVAAEKNMLYVRELITAMQLVTGYQIVITMPNADTFGDRIRQELLKFIEVNEHVTGIESLGTVGYLSCMAYCVMMLGNTSSGFVEAAFFPKYVINLGKRQEGRIVTENIRNCPIEHNAILAAISDYKHTVLPESIDIYGNGTAAPQIISILKRCFGE